MRVRTFIRRSFVVLACALCPAPFVRGDGLADRYREAKAALESGEPAKAIALLEPVLADANSNDAAPAQLALGIAYLRTGKAERALPWLEKAAARFAGTPQGLADALAPLGDARRAAGKRDAAREAFARAAESHSPNGHYALARLAELDGEAAEAEGDFPRAATNYLDAGDRLLALGPQDAAYYADARALFEKVAKNPDLPPKGWRGEATARAVFSMGEVERAQKHFPEAIAYYQRTFVSWLKYPVWPARAYLRAAECMDALGKREFAKAHLRELMRKVEKFGTLPEYEQAKKQLRAWGEEVR